MKYFARVKTIEELRKKYRKLLKKYHPDNEGGNVEITQAINAEYDAEYDCLFADLSEENQSDKEKPLMIVKPKKKCWCWHYGNYVRYCKGAEISLEEIRQKYGSQTVNRKSKQYAIS